MEHLSLMRRVLLGGLLVLALFAFQLTSAEVLLNIFQLIKIWDFEAFRFRQRIFFDIIAYAIISPNPMCL
jgi:hypothetical protein